MIRRKLAPKVIDLSKQYPVVTITGPRQSGKTTLTRECFPEYSYHSLEDVEQREFAREDPRSFLAQAKNMIIDEIQKVPDLVSYIQGVVDEEDREGQFILTGSHQFELATVVSQSLAGRTALVKLLPFSFAELNEKTPLSEILYRGFYPRIIDKGLNPTEALSFYTNTYLERDVRDIKEIRNLAQFESFLKLCATQVGQILNKNRLSNDIGIDNKTVESWLSVLQASFVISLLPPHYKNFRKRLVKSPKLYFYDVGLASFLLGIKNPGHVDAHPLKGALFENFVIMEKMKQRLNRVETPSLYFFRDSVGNEVDLLEEVGPEVYSFEIKLAQTLNSSAFKGLNFYKKLNPENTRSVLVYTGEKRVERSGHLCLSYEDLTEYT